MFFSTLAVLAVLGVANAQNATIPSQSPVSSICGQAFDRIAIIWLENTDFTKASGDPNLAWLAKKGITLSNYYGVTHPSEPNYISAIGGDNFGLDGDGVIDIPDNVFTVLDLLDDQGIAWGEYQEDMPSAGYQGAAYVNQKTQANDYVRKHNPAASYSIVSNKPERLGQIKPLTSFFTDLENETLPQYMFITPNMTSDGHDTSVTTAGAWSRNFLEPLLDDERFMNRTMVLLTFDENHTYTAKNNIMAILLGDAVPQELVGTTDDTFYNHYSSIATVEANWQLSTLGRWDTGANVFSWVAQQTGDVAQEWPEVTGSSPSVFLNESYAGPYNSVNTSVPFPVPNIDAVVNGRSVLQAIIDLYSDSDVQTIYDTGIKIPDGMHPPAGY